MICSVLKVWGKFEKNQVDDRVLGTSLEELVAALEEIEREELDNSSDNSNSQNNVEEANSEEDGSIIFPGQEENSAGKNKNKGVFNQGKKINTDKNRGGLKDSTAIKRGKGNRKINNKKGNKNTGSSKNNRKNGKNKFGSGKKNQQNGSGKGSGNKRNNSFKNSLPLNGLYSRPNQTY